MGLGSSDGVRSVGGLGVGGMGEGGQLPTTPAATPLQFKTVSRGAAHQNQPCSLVVGLLSVKFDCNYEQPV